MARHCIHWLQHVPLEGLRYIAPWTREHGHTPGVTRLQAGEALPAPDAFDCLVVMGGPMGICDTNRHLHLTAAVRLLDACPTRLAR
jgi:GMP synthase-like glutamine amidotransferase